MHKFSRNLIALSALVVWPATAAIAKRVDAKPVAPVIANGVRYSAELDGSDQYVIATKISTSEQLWKVKVFHTHVKFWEEEDNQWVYITDLELVSDSLFVRDEKSRCYAVNIISKRVKHQPCEGTFPQRAPLR